MTVTTGIPTASQSLGETQGLIQTNFTEMTDHFAVNHVGYNDGADAGKHNFLTMPNQGTLPADAPTTLADEGALYVLGNNLLFREQSDGTQQQISGSVVDGANGECPLFGGFSLKWGFVSGAGTTVTVTYTGIGLTAFGTNTYSVTFAPTTLTGVTVNPRISAKSKTSFTITSTNAGISHYWMAIGK